MATPAPAQNRAPGQTGIGYNPSKLDEILVRFPDLLDANERLLPDGPRYDLIRRKVAGYTNQHRAKAAAMRTAGGEGGQAGQGGQRQPLQPPQNMQQQQQQQMQMQQNGTPVMQHVGVQQHQSPAQGGQGMGAQGMPMENGQVYQQQQLYQQQQQQQQGNYPQQSQQHMKTMLETQARLRQAQQQQTPHMHQQNQTQQQGQNQLQAISALPPNMTAPSPQQQQQQLMGSPSMGQRNGRSPSQGSASNQQMRVPTPVQMNAQLPMPGQGQMQQQQQQASQQPQMGNAKVLIDNFPMLWDMKRKGKLGPDQEKLFNQLLESKEGRAHLEHFQAQNASTLVNRLGQIQAGQQQPMTHAQMALAAQQSLAPLQQQQAMHAQQAQNAAQGQHFVNPQGGATGGANGQPIQLSQQQHLQMQAMAQVAQRNQSQQNLGILANPQQQQLSIQAQALARSQVAQQQMMVAHQNMQAQHAQQAQVQALRDQQMQHGDPNAYTGSPRPGGGGMMQVQGQGQSLQAPPRNPKNTAAQVQHMLQRVSAMTDAEKETFFAGKPELRPLYHSLINNPSSLASLQNISNAQALQQQQQMGQNGPGTPGNNGSPAMANGNGQFPPNNQSRVSANLHIPANKQRNLLPNQNVGTPSSQGSPARTQPTPQQAALRQMINSGIPVQNGGAGIARPGSVGMQGQVSGYSNLNLQSQMQQMDPKTIKPEMIISQIDPNMPRQRAPSMAARRDSEMQSSANGFGLNMADRSDSLLAQAKWVPDAAYDLALREKLCEFQPPVKASGRATLMQGFAQGRVMSDVPLERVPDAIRAIAEQADKESLAQKKKEVDPALPSRKKRKIQDVAESVDRGLVINREVEFLLLKLADEHMETICQVACNLAKHRRSDTLERKDLQLAYENILGRSFPGFSSDQIRMDQSKPAKRPPVNAARVNKLRLLNDAKAAWRKEKAEERAELGESGGGGNAVVAAAA